MMATVTIKIRALIPMEWKEIVKVVAGWRKLETGVQC